MNIITLKQASESIKNGEVGVLPTDTLMGVVASAQNVAAVQRLYNLKDRQNKPGTLLAANVTQLTDLRVKRRYLTAVEQYWPNPISIIIPCANDELAYLHQDKQSLAVRIPRSDYMKRLLEQTGPIMSTSANLPGKPPAVTLDEARAYFGEGVDFYVQEHDDMLHEASTLIQIVDDTIVVLRYGAAKINEQTGAITI